MSETFEEVFISEFLTCGECGAGLGTEYWECSKCHKKKHCKDKIFCNGILGMGIKHICEGCYNDRE